MGRFVTWIKSKNWHTHAVLALALSVAGVVARDHQAQQFVINLFASHPAWASQIVLFAVVIAKYTHSSSPAGTVATATALLDKSNATAQATIAEKTVADPQNQKAIQ